MIKRNYWGITAAKGAKLPSVSLTHSDLRSGIPGVGSGNTFSNDISVSMPIY